MNHAARSFSTQAEFVARCTGLYRTTPDPVAARQVATLAVDTYAIARYARACGIGATVCDRALAAQSGPVAVWGDGTSDAPGAAFLNGCAAEALDFQEVLIDGRNNGHAAVVIVPALIALARARDVPASDVIAAMRTAFCANIALARTLGRGHRRETPGFRTTSLVAPLAAALAGALMCGATQAQANHALSIAAATLPAGLLSAMSPLSGDFSLDKDLSVGFSARHAVDCILLALAGATGPADALTGPRGWTASYGFGSEDTAHLAADPALADLSAYALKLYPANFGCQSAIRLALDIADTLDPAAIDAVEVRVKSSSAASLSARAIHGHVAARFSLAYSVASAFVRRRSVLDDFEGDSLSDAAVVAFMDRIALIADDGFEARHLTEGIFPAQLTVTCRDGSTLQRMIPTPQDGMGPDALQAAFGRKLHSLCPPDEAAALLHLLRAGEIEAVFAALLDNSILTEKEVSQ